MNRLSTAYQNRNGIDEANLLCVPASRLQPSGQATVLGQPTRPLDARAEQRKSCNICRLGHIMSATYRDP
jgi:hypothetical protein